MKTVKKILGLGLIVIYLTSCGSGKFTNYKASLNNVNGIVVSGNEAENIQSYSDKNLEISASHSLTSFFFNIKNKSEKSIKIIWDESNYVDIFGNSTKIIHNGTKLIERENSQIPTIIPVGAKLNETIVPSSNIYYQSGKYGGWKTNNLFTYATGDSKEDKNSKQKLIGQKSKVILTFLIEEQKVEYIFEFELNNVNW